MGRRAVTDRLDRLVREHRVTIAVVFPVVGALLLLLTAAGVLPLPAVLLGLAILTGTLIMRLPLVAGALPLASTRGAIAVAVVVCYTYTIEFVGLRTGWPYGDFAYGLELGPTVAQVPLALPLFFLPLVLDGYLLSILALRDRATRAAFRIPLAIGAVVVIDLILDPAAVAIGFWTFSEGGYYGVPRSNYAGWLLSATIAVGTIDAGVDVTRVRERLAACPYLLDDAVSFVLLWG